MSDHPRTMRLISYRDDGGERIGVRDGTMLIDVAAAYAALAADGDASDDAASLERALSSTMVEFLSAGDGALDAAREAVAFAKKRGGLAVEEASIELLPVVPRPPKIICVARNYAEHAEEANLQVLQVPNLFIRFAQSLVAHGAPIVVPNVSDQVDWEAELAVIIGKSGKHVAAANAFDYVAGYAPFNDVSIRDWQLRKPPVQFGAGKNFDGSGPLGPELVTRDEVSNPHTLRIELTVNGEVMQSSSTASMIFDIPTLIEHISQFTTLEPGDVIATGTPSGVGHFREPPTYLKPGDSVRVEIEGMTALENPVEAER